MIVEVIPVFVVCYSSSCTPCCCHMPSTRRTAPAVTQCASRTRKRRAPVSRRRRLGGGAKSAKQKSKDAKVQSVIMQILKCSKDVTTKLQKYHDDPAGEEQFTKLMTGVLLMARHTNAKLVKTMLNSLLPRGKYEIRTVSRTEIDRVSREMHADRGFMKRNTASGFRARILMFNMGLVMGIAFMTAGLWASHDGLNEYPGLLLLVVILSAGVGVRVGRYCMRYTIARMTRNAYKLETIVKQC